MGKQTTTATKDNVTVSYASDPVSVSLEKMVTKNADWPPQVQPDTNPTPKFGPDPISVTCPACREVIQTTTEYVSGALSAYRSNGLNLTSQDWFCCVLSFIGTYRCFYPFLFSPLQGC